MQEVIYCLRCLILQELQIRDYLSGKTGILKTISTEQDWNIQLTPVIRGQYLVLIVIQTQLTGTTKPAYIQASCRHGIVFPLME